MSRMARILRVTDMCRAAVVVLTDKAKHEDGVRVLQHVVPDCGDGKRHRRVVVVGGTEPFRLVEGAALKLFGKLKVDVFELAQQEPVFVLPVADLVHIASVPPSLNISSKSE